LAVSSLPANYAKLTAQSSSIDLLSLNHEFLSAQPETALRVFAFARGQQVLDHTAALTNQDAVIALLDDEEQDLSLEIAIEALHVLKELGAEHDMLASAAAKINIRLPEAKVVERIVEGEFQ